MVVVGGGLVGAEAETGDTIEGALGAVLHGVVVARGTEHGEAGSGSLGLFEAGIEGLGSSHGDGIAEGAEMDGGTGGRDLIVGAEALHKELIVGAGGEAVEDNGVGRSGGRLPCGGALCTVFDIKGQGTGHPADCS